MALRNAQVKRELYVRRIREIYEASRRVDTDPQGRDNFLSQYSEVAGIAEAFDAVHLKIIQDPTSEFEAEDKVRAEFDKWHYAIKSKHFSLVKASRPPAGISDSKSAPKVKLPKIALPNFNGELSVWPSYFALFSTAVHNNVQLSNIEKYQYLLSSLSGEALSVVSNLQFSEEHYTVAYDLLVARYQDKRELATHYWRAISQSKVLKEDSSTALRQLVGLFNESTRALKLMQFPVESWDFVLLNILLDRLTPSLREKFEAEHRKSELPTYVQLVEFLTEYCKVYSSSSGVTNSSIRSQGHASRSRAGVSSFVSNTESCPSCEEQHLVTKCPRFLEMSSQARHTAAKRLNLCLNCLRTGHRLRNCTSAGTCKECKARHHTLLHFGPRSQSFEALVDAADPSTSDAGASSSAPNAQSLATMTSVLESDSVVLLSTVQAEALDVHGRPFPVRILLDSASQANFVTENCMQQGGYSRSGHRASIMAVGDTRATTTRGRTSLVIRSRGCSDLRFPIEATILTRISARLPNRPIRRKSWKHLEGLRLADPEYYRPNPVDVLIGADIFASLLRDGRCLGDRGEPDAFNTVFGWVLTGAVSPSMISSVQSFLTLDSIDDSVRKFWELEEVPQVSSLSEEDRQCEELFGRTTRRAASGRFIVSYPFAKDNPCFSLNSDK